MRKIRVGLEGVGTLEIEVLPNSKINIGELFTGLQSRFGNATNSTIETDPKASYNTEKGLDPSYPGDGESG